MQRGASGGAETRTNSESRRLDAALDSHRAGGMPDITAAFTKWIRLLVNDVLSVAIYIIGSTVARDGYSSRYRGGEQLRLPTYGVSW